MRQFQFGILFTPRLGKISPQKFHIGDPVDDALALVGGELFGEIRHHFRRRQVAQLPQILAPKGALNFPETLFEDRKIGLSGLQLRVASGPGRPAWKVENALPELNSPGQNPGRVLGKVRRSGTRVFPPG